MDTFEKWESFNEVEQKKGEEQKKMTCMIENPSNQASRSSTNPTN